MKFVCWFIGLIVGVFLCLIMMNSNPILGLGFILGGMYLGGYIGGRIEEEDRENERRAREDYECKRIHEEYNRQRKLQKKAEAQSLARMYPEATKYYFKYIGVSQRQLLQIMI